MNDYLEFHVHIISGLILPLAEKENNVYNEYVNHDAHLYF